MAYDPFARGPFAVGERGGEAIDPDRSDRRLPFAVWYPEDAGSGERPRDVAAAYPERVS